FKSFKPFKMSEKQSGAVERSAAIEHLERFDQLHCWLPIARDRSGLVLGNCRHESSVIRVLPSCRSTIGFCDSGRKLTLQAPKKLPHHLFSHTLEQTLANASDKTADLGISANQNGCLVRFRLFQRELSVSTNKSRRARAVDDELVAKRGIFFAHQNLPAKCPLDGPYADLQRRLELVDSDFSQSLTTRCTCLQRLRIGQQVPYRLGRGRKNKTPFNLHLSFHRRALFEPRVCVYTVPICQMPRDVKYPFGISQSMTV